MKNLDPLSESIRGNTPLLVLTMIERGHRHGYAISQQIEQLSDHKIRLAEATIYPALRMLERQKLIEGEWITPETGVPRKEYKLTDLGKAELSKRRQFWLEFSSAINTLIGGVVNGSQDRDLSSEGGATS